MHPRHEARQEAFAAQFAWRDDVAGAPAAAAARCNAYVGSKARQHAHATAKRRLSAQKAVQLMFFRALDVVKRWWIGLKIRWLLKGLHVAKRIRITLALRTYADRAIENFRKRRRARASSLALDFLRRCSKVGSFAIRRLLRRVRCFQRASRGWIETRRAHVFTMDRAFRREELRFKSELAERRLLIEGYACRRMEKSNFFGTRVQALAAADSRLQRLLPITGKSYRSRAELEETTFAASDFGRRPRCQRYESKRERRPRSNATRASANNVALVPTLRERARTHAISNASQVRRDAPQKGRSAENGPG